jgi:hypothetical protein
MKLIDFYNQLMESMVPKYKVGQVINGLGKIKKIYPQKSRGEVWFQYDIDGSYYAERVLDDAESDSKIKNISFNKIKDLIQKINSGNASEQDIDFAWKLFKFLNTSAGRESFKKYDTKIVSKFNWLQANLNAAISKYKQE